MSERPAVDRDVLAAAFERTAASYERGRPGYPADAVEMLVAEFGLAGARVLDLAAGTGKFSRVLLDHGAEVVAVEPLAAMREQFAAVVSSAEVLEGTAEVIPLPDESVDAVTVAQAFHWFRAPEALAEIARVLRPGGGLVLLWNEAYERDALTKRLFDAVRTVGNRPETIEVDWRIVVDESGWFEPMRRGRYRWTDTVSHHDLLASVESRSYVSVLEPEPRRSFLEGLAELLIEYPEPFPLPYVTEVYWCRRLSTPNS